MAAGIVPMLKVDWDGYSAEEVARRAEKLRLDAVVAPVFAGWYLVQAACVTAAQGSAAAAAAAPPSATSLAARTALAAAAAYVLAVHCCAFPAPTAVQDAWKVQSVFGRWVYLTRHCVTLQMWHQVLSLASTWLPGLVALTHGMSIWIATLGWFVTVQYFVLVAPSQTFKEDCELWRKRGVHFKELGVLLHAPALPIAVLDLLLGKSAAVLSGAVSWQSTIVLLAAYVLLYLSLIIVNYKLVGMWPYGFMKAFGTDIRRWVSFSGGQVMVLLVFLAANAILFWLKTTA